jgi:hypothetical protein
LTGVVVTESDLEEIYLSIWKPRDAELSVSDTDNAIRAALGGACVLKVDIMPALLDEISTAPDQLTEVPNATLRLREGPYANSEIGQSILTLDAN